MHNEKPPLEGCRKQFLREASNLLTQTNVISLRQNLDFFIDTQENLLSKMQKYICIVQEKEYQIFLDHLVEHWRINNYQIENDFAAKVLESGRHFPKNPQICELLELLKAITPRELKRRTVDVEVRMEHVLACSITNPLPKRNKKNYPIETRAALASHNYVISYFHHLLTLNLNPLLFDSSLEHFLSFFPYCETAHAQVLDLSRSEGPKLDDSNNYIFAWLEDFIFRNIVLYSAEELRSFFAATIDDLYEV